MLRSTQDMRSRRQLRDALWMMSSCSDLRSRVPATYSVANVSDLSHHTIDTFDYLGRPQVIPPWRPADTRFDDHSRVSAPVGSYRPNPWGLFDMHGNVAEWTRSQYRPYPYQDDDRNDGTAGKRVVRGGSWYDPPNRCRAAFRQARTASCRSPFVSARQSP